MARPSSWWRIATGRTRQRSTCSASPRRIEQSPSALTEGWIAGAALDTHFAYPLPPEHPLWRMPNVVLTPHIAGADKSRAFPGRIAELFAENVTRYRDGRPLLNEVTPQEWREA